MSVQEQVTEEFERQFETLPDAIVRAPGRVNLIGEHTDYNDGFVLPMAIDRAVWIALRPRNDSYVVVHSLDFNEIAEFSPIEMAKQSQRYGRWAEYMKGVAWALQEAGYSLQGWEGVLAGDVPIGAGLSSSAAMELATARAFATITPLDWDPVAMAKICQRAENEWVGMKSGIMDQMISAAGVEGRALLIDCRSLALEPVPLPPNTMAVVMDTTTRRELVTSAYNERREQCEAAARFFNVPALRDVTIQQFEAAVASLDPVVAKRARHIITENDRTVQAAQAMQAGDAATLGELMDASHASLRDDFEVTNDALNQIVACAQKQKGCYGARMTGAGFGGCAVALVAEASVAAFTAGVTRCYREATGLEAKIYVSPAVEGASVILPVGG
jgi:galactokinase